MHKFANAHYQEKYQSNPHFRQMVDRSENEYQCYLEKAEEKKGELGVNESILQKYLTTDSRNIYFWYGCLQPTPGKNSVNLTLAFMKNFQIKPDQRFIFVYFNHETASSDYYFEFKHIFSMLPLRMIEQMQVFILIKPYFYIKACEYVGLGAINKYFNKHYLTLDTCSQLLEKLKISVHDFVSFVPEEISQEFPPTLKRRASLQNYRINLEGQTMSEEELKQKHEFEISIKALITKEVYLLQHFELSDIGIPIIIQVLIHYFRRKPEGLSEQGIFRKSVSIDEQNETLTELCKRNYDYLAQITNCHLIASLIKKFFNNLKQPMIPYPAFNTLMHNQGVVDKREQLKQVIYGLPKLNYLTLMFLLQFLKKDVIPHEKSSKMTTHNIAICFSPSLMRSEVPSQLDLVYAGKSVNVTEMLINELDYIFGNDEERKGLLKKSMIDNMRQFKKQIRKQLDIDDNSTVFQGHSQTESIQELEEKVQHIQVGEPTGIKQEMDLDRDVEVPRVLVTRSFIKEAKREEDTKGNHFTMTQKQYPRSETITIEPEEQVRIEINRKTVKQSMFNKKQAEHYLPTQQPQTHPQDKPGASTNTFEQSHKATQINFNYTHPTKPSQRQY